MNKVLILVPTLPSGGAERFAINLANYLARENFIVVIYNIGKSEELTYLIDFSKIQYIYDPRNSKFDLKPLRNLFFYAKSNSVKYFIFIELFGFFYAKLLTIFYNLSFKSFITFHYTDVRNKKERIQYFLFSQLITRRDKIVAICKYQRKKLLKENKFPFKEEEIPVIYNGVDSDFFTLPPPDFDHHQIRDELNIPYDSKVIIKVAGFRKEKRHVDAIYALFELHTKYKQKAYLLFAGNDTSDIVTHLKSHITKLSLQDYVIFLGYHKDVRKYLWISDLFTLTSNSVETFSFAALEALSTGLPLVLTDLGGASEMVINNFNGVVVPPNNTQAISNAWNRILNDKFDRTLIAIDTRERFFIDNINRTYKVEISNHINETI